MSAISGISSCNTNSYLAALNASASAAALRQMDSDVRTQALRKSTASGSDATVITQLQYTVGPDGQLYATGGTVSTSKKVSGPVNTARLEKPREEAPEYDAANDNQNKGFTPRRNLTLADIINPQLDVSSADFAQLFSENTGENIAKAKLQLSDADVRTHEHQHFFTAGGLVSGTPNYDTASGPDGEFYAVGGDVSIGTTPTSDPAKAARDAESFSLAATAPGDASAQDLKVARSSYGKAAAFYNASSALGNQTIFNLVA